MGVKVREGVEEDVGVDEEVIVRVGVEVAESVAVVKLAGVICAAKVEPDAKEPISIADGADVGRDAGAMQPTDARITKSAITFNVSMG